MRLIDGIGKAFIVTHNEPTQLLEEFLTKEGFQWEILRQKKQREYQNYSQSYLCLLNHRQTWEKAFQERKPTLIIEADFVPVIGFAKLPLPFAPCQKNVGVSWLYTCAAQVYGISNEGYAEGFSVSTVAYIVTPQAAKCLLELEEKIRGNPGPTVYSTWDSTLDRFLRAKQFQNYITFRNYGEHGGNPNPEHKKHGLSRTHRADVLQSKLAFTPLYAAEGPMTQLKLLSVRIKARMKGIARLALGKFLKVHSLKRSHKPVRLLSFAIRRQLTLQV